MLQRASVYLSDDCALMKRDLNGTLVAHALYRTAKLEQRLLDRALPQFHSLTTTLRHDRGKVILAFAADDPRLLTSCPTSAAAVVHACPQASATDSKRTSPAHVLRALAPSTIFQNRAGPATLSRLARWLSAVPCYEIQTGRDLAHLAATVRGLL